jgi:GntR family transcriptional repressor for pyruvate dehydrogenase complex
MAIDANNDVNDSNKEVVFAPPRKVTIVESIVGQFVAQIQAGKLKPGDRLPSERHLIEMLGVSRSSVREALQGLIAMGLVDSRPGQGTFVSATRARLLPNLDSTTVANRLQREMRLQLVEARRLIEPPIARLAAERATPAGIAVLRQCLAVYNREPFAPAPAPHLPSPHSALHLALADMSGNPFLVATVDNILSAVPLTLRERERIARDDADVRQTNADEIAMHTAIVDAVAIGDTAAAFKAMDAHLDYERRLVEELFPEDSLADER